MYKATVDPGRCVQSATCQYLEPDHFRWSDKGASEWIEDASELPKERLLEVADNCPVAAIRVVTDDGAVVH